jgi:cyclase
MADRLRLLERRDIDELIILDISATPNNRPPRFDEIKELLSNVFCPITVGGGVRSLGDIRRLLSVGADKVALGTAATPKLIEEASQRFGAQAVVISIDVKKTVNTHCGRIDTLRDPVEWAKECEARGAGEILLTSIERDGTMTGYDLDLISAVSNALTIPVIACGGCGSYNDMTLAMKAGAHAVAAGAMFQFRELTPKGASRYLNDHGIPARV